MLPSEISSKQYVLSLDSLDLSFLSHYVGKITEERKLLWSKPFMDGDSAYYQIELVSEELQDEDYCLKLYESYICNLCHVEVPLTCYVKHIKSKMHQCYKTLTEKVLENVARQIKNDIDYNMNYDDKGCYYCEICSKLVSLKYQQKHNLSSCHLKSIDKEELANNFLNMYMQSQETKPDSNICPMEDVNENHTEYNSILNTKCLRSVENSVPEISSAASLIPINEEFVSSSITSESFKNGNENRTSFELYLKSMIERYNLNFNLPIVENDHIIIVTPKGYKESVTFDTFHGYKKVVGFVFCQLCQMWVEHNIEQHSATELHVRNILQPVNDNFLREVKNYTSILNKQFSYCLICNEIVPNDSNHGLINPNHKKYNHGNVENTEVTVSSKTTFCDICSINIDSGNFLAHTKGKKHMNKLNTKTQINSRNVLNFNTKPVGISSLDSTSGLESLDAKFNKQKKFTNLPTVGVCINDKKFCDVCHTYIITNDFSLHINGKKHKDKLKAKAGTPMAKPKSVNILSNFCNVCQVPIPLGGMGIHIAGKPHRSKQMESHKTEDIQITTEGKPSSSNDVIQLPCPKRKRTRTRPKKKRIQAVQDPE